MGYLTDMKICSTLIENSTTNCLKQMALFKILKIAVFDI